MEKYILKAAFMLTLINTISPEFTLARNVLKNVASDSSKLNGKFYSKEPRSHGRPLRLLNPAELDNAAGYLVLKSDTGKYFRRSFFQDAPHMGKRFIDSLISNLPQDSVFRGFKFRADSTYRRWGRLLPGDHDNSIAMPNMLRRNPPGMRIDRFDLPDRLPGTQKNSQSFSFRSTDKDGITTRIRIDVEDPSQEELKKITSEVPENMLSVSELSFLPEFSSQNVTLMFSLPGKGSVSIKILDNEWKSVYSDTAPQLRGRYSKVISLPKNGIYFLVIGQNNRSFIKRLRSSRDNK